MEMPNAVANLINLIHIILSQLKSLA